MKRIIQFAAVLCIVLGISALLTTNFTVKAQVSTPIVVQPGDQFTYGTSDGSPWITMIPSYAPPLSEWDMYANLTTWNITVIPTPDPQDNPTEIWVNQTVRLRNGTATQPAQGLVDVDIGLGSIVLFFIPADLHAGDRIYPDSTNFTWTVNYTRVDETHWPGRTICVLNYTTAGSNTTSSNLFADRQVIYWDQATGVLLSAFEEAATYDVQAQAGIEGYLLYQLIGDNIGIPLNYSGPPSYTPVYAAIAVALVIALAIGVVYAVRSSQTPKNSKKFKKIKKS